LFLFENICVVFSKKKIEIVHKNNVCGLRKCFGLELCGFGVFNMIFFKRERKKEKLGPGRLELTTFECKGELFLAPFH
jgi:hypothetical protein